MWRVSLLNSGEYPLHNAASILSRTIHPLDEIARLQPERPKCGYSKVMYKAYKTLIAPHCWFDFDFLLNWINSSAIFTDLQNLLFSATSVMAEIQSTGEPFWSVGHPCSGIQTTTAWSTRTKWGTLLLHCRLEFNTVFDLVENCYYY